MLSKSLASEHPMSISRFHLVLTTSLAVVLGGTLTQILGSAIAEGYPTGTVISTGHNPVVAQGGHLNYSGDEHTVFTAPSDQNIVLTDVVLTGGNTNYDCRGQSRVTLQLASGLVLGVFAVDQRAAQQSQTGSIVAHYDSGLPVPAGDSVLIRTDGNYASCGSTYHFVDYSISGYLAQP
jgi:hypothetical protein